MASSFRSRGCRKGEKKRRLGFIFMFMKSGGWIGIRTPAFQESRDFV